MSASDNLKRIRIHMHYYAFIMVTDLPEQQYNSIYCPEKTA
jgi:hypothetical protein